MEFVFVCVCVCALKIFVCVWLDNFIHSLLTPHSYDNQTKGNGDDDNGTGDDNDDNEAVTIRKRLS